MMNQDLGMNADTDTTLLAKALASHLTITSRIADGDPSETPVSASELAVPTDDSAARSTNDRKRRPLILCDLGYGFPKEERPRREKLLAIAKQLVNFFRWQQSAPRASRSESQGTEDCPGVTLIPAQLLLVGCSDSHVQEALTNRMRQLWGQQARSIDVQYPFPEVEFSNQPISSFANAIYLSPDAPAALDVTQPPPDTVVVGMLIDRRIQVNRSAQRAGSLALPAARWPLELVSGVLDPCEPLNVDCVLEGMQQWHWNYEEFRRRNAPRGCPTAQVCFERAAVQALRHHQKRHPHRPQHKSPSSSRPFAHSLQHSTDF